MATKFLGIISSVILILYNVCPIHGQEVYENQLHRNYNLAKIVEDAYVELARSSQLTSEMKRQNTSLLDEIVNTFNTSVNSLLLEHLINIANSKCAQDIAYTIEKSFSKEMWAFDMIDSFGKPGSGILQGNIKWLGNYDECIQVYAPPIKMQNDTRGDFHGQYCTLQVTVPLGKLPIPFSMGVCVPDSCSVSEFMSDEVKEKNRKITSSLGLSYSFNSIFGNKTTLTCPPASKKITPAAIGVICLFSLAILLSLIGSSITAFEYFAKRFSNDFSDSYPPIGKSTDRSFGDHELLVQNKEDTILPVWIQKCNSVFNCFCVFTNGEKLLNTSNVEGQMLCLHGIRFLSMAWVIVCHTYGMCLTGVNNSREALPLLDNWLFQIIQNGFFSVDSFFLLSGFLLAYLFFEQSSKIGKIPWVYFYAHRYLRLTPVYMVVLGFYTAIYPIMGSGPFWPSFNIDPSCSKSWWMNLLYINNFQHGADMCMGWSWYLSNDMQFFVISPLILVPLWRFPQIGFSVLAVFFLATFVTTFTITDYYGLPSSMGDLGELAKGQVDGGITKWGEFMDKVYFKPYTRIGPYLVGIVLAYYIFKRKQENKDSKNSLVVLIIGWALATGVTLACQFGLYHSHLSLLEASFYNTFSRTCYACGVGWVIYVCLTEQKSIVNRILSFKLFIPLSRLTYCAYLVHLTVVSYYFQTLRDTFDFFHLKIVFLFLGLLTVSYGVAFVTSLLFESPIIRLEKFVRKKFSRT